MCSWLFPSVMVRESCFSACGVLESPTVHPHAPTQSKRKLPRSTRPLKAFSLHCASIYGACGVGAPQQFSEKQFENKSCSSLLLVLSGVLGHSSVSLGRNCFQRGKVFLGLQPWNRKRWCLTLSGATGAADILRFWNVHLRPLRKRLSKLLVSGQWRQAIQKKANQI